MLHACTCVQMWKLVPLKLLVANPPRKVCHRLVCANVHVYMLVCLQQRLSQSLNLSHVTCKYMYADVEAGSSQAARGKSSKKKGLS